MTLAARPRAGSRFLLTAAAVVVVIAGLKLAQSLVIPFLLALFLAIICLPVVSWLTRRKVPTALAVLAVVLVLLAVFAGFGAVIGGSVNEFAAFASQYQERFDGLQESVTAWLVARDIEPESLDMLEMVKPGELMNLFGAALKGLAAVLSNLFLIVLTMIFMLLEAASVPTKVRAAVGSTRMDIDRLTGIVTQVQRYLAIKTGTSLATGLLIGIWTAAIGLEFAVVWGLVAFLLNYIPSIGSVVAAVPAVFLALVQGGVGYALLVALGYVVVNVTIGNFAEPYLLGRTLGLSTLVVFLSLAFWGWLWGSIGMLLSVPLTMIIKIFLENTRDLKWVAIMLDSGRGAARRLEAAEAEAGSGN